MFFSSNRLIRGLGFDSSRQVQVYRIVFDFLPHDLNRGMPPRGIERDSRHSDVQGERQRQESDDSLSE